jgi:hypothetical protein
MRLENANYLLSWMHFPYGRQRRRHLGGVMGIVIDQRKLMNSANTF